MLYPPLSLYIHIPWCIKKCPYCDFNSHALANQDDALFCRYVDALIDDAHAQAPLFSERWVRTVFIGGGTPSLLAPHHYARLFDALRGIFKLDTQAEITMEANAGTLEHAPFEGYLAAGINRLSIGVQSFNDEALRVLGRVHDGVQAETAILNARKAGFLRVNVDLMHGLPMQTRDKAAHDIARAHDSGATHISWYQLTIEPNTRFYRAPPQLPDEEKLGQIEQDGRALLASLGYVQYEISAYHGKDDIPCAHNVNYWQFGDYIAIGAGAHGKVSHPSGEPTHKPPIYRYQKTRAPKDYLINHAHTLRPIRPNELVGEYMMGALRLKNGVSWDAPAKVGVSLDGAKDTINNLQARGLLDTERLCATDRGFLYLNQVMAAFL